MNEELLNQLAQNTIQSGQVVTPVEKEAAEQNLQREINNLRSSIADFNASLSEDQQDFAINDSDNKVSEFLSLLRAKAERGVIDIKTASQPAILDGELSIFKNDMFLQNRVDTLYNRAVDKGINASLKFAFTGLTASQIAQTSVFLKDPIAVVIELGATKGTQVLIEHLKNNGAKPKEAEAEARMIQGSAQEEVDLDNKDSMLNDVSFRAFLKAHDIDAPTLKNVSRSRISGILLKAMKDSKGGPITLDEEMKKNLTPDELIVCSAFERKTGNDLQEFFEIISDKAEEAVHKYMENRKGINNKDSQSDYYDFEKVFSDFSITLEESDKYKEWVRLKGKTSKEKISFEHMMDNSFRDIVDPNINREIYNVLDQINFYKIGDAGILYETFFEKIESENRNNGSIISEVKRESKPLTEKEISELTEKFEDIKKQTQEPLQPEQPIVQEQPQQEEQIVQEPLQPEQPIVQEQPQQEEQIVQEQPQEEIQEATQEEITREENKPEQPKEQAQVQENRGNGFNPDIDTKIDSKEHSENAVGAKKSIIDRIKDGLQSVSERRALGEPLGVIVFKKLGDWGELLTNLPERIAKKKEQKQIESGFGSKKMALAEGVAKEETTVVEQEERKDTAQPVSEFDKRYQVSPEALASMAPQQEQVQQVQTQEQVQETDAIEQALGELGDEGIDPSVLEGLTEKPDEKGGDEPEL